MNKAKIEAIKTARKIIALKPVYLDIETTGQGADDQIVEIALIESDGAILINTLIRPTTPIPAASTAIHGITNEDVSRSPAWSEIIPNLAAYNDRMIVVYDRDYVLRMSSQTAEENKTDPWAPRETVCAMELYAQYHGDWDNYYAFYLRQPLKAAAEQLGIDIPPDLHRAAADADLCREIVKAMADTALPDKHGM